MFARQVTLLACWAPRHLLTMMPSRIPRARWNPFGQPDTRSHPLKKHRTWQYTATPSTTAGEAAELRKFNGQSIRNARKKAKGAEKQKRQPANLSLSAHCVQALAKVNRLSLDRIETRREKLFPGKCPELSCLLRTKML